jgi:hypothetical protein
MHDGNCILNGAMNAACRKPPTDGRGYSGGDSAAVVWSAIISSLQKPDGIAITWFGRREAVRTGSTTAPCYIQLAIAKFTAANIRHCAGLFQEP